MEPLRYERMNAFHGVYSKLQDLIAHVDSYFQTKEAAINAYTAYYNEKTKCQGLKEKMESLENISQFSGS